MVEGLAPRTEATLKQKQQQQKKVDIEYPMSKIGAMQDGFKMGLWLQDNLGLNFLSFYWDQCMTGTEKAYSRKKSKNKK